MINSRAKGATFERQTAAILNEFFALNDIDFVCERNLEQVRTGNQCDIIIPFHAIECKHYKQGGLHWYKQQWWNQACNSAAGRIPVLIFKYNRTPAKVVIPLYAINPQWQRDNEKLAVLSMPEWLRVLRMNWEFYRAFFRPNGEAPIRKGDFKLSDYSEYRRTQ